MRKAKWAIATTLSIGVISLGWADSASAQFEYLYTGQEHIERGTMDRNRRSRGQTRTLYGNPSENPSDESSASNDQRSLVTYSPEEGPGVFLGVIELVDGTIPRNRTAFEAALEAMEWEIIPSGLAITPTGRAIDDKLVPVRVDSTGQTGVIFIQQIRVAE